MKITVQNRYIAYGLIVALSILSFSVNQHIKTLTSKVETLTETILSHEKRLNDVTDALLKAEKATKAIYTQPSMLDSNLLRAVIAVESSGDPDAYNTHTGAVGLMQLTPIIYKKVCGLSKTEAFEPSKNIACGSMFLSHLLKKFNGNLERALVYYNAGTAMNNPKYAIKVKKHLKGK